MAHRQYRLSPQLEPNQACMNYLTVNRRTGSHQAGIKGPASQRRRCRCIWTITNAHKSGMLLSDNRARTGEAGKKPWNQNTLTLCSFQMDQATRTTIPFNLFFLTTRMPILAKDYTSERGALMARETGPAERFAPYDVRD